jgi:hypothetical protein
LFIHGVGEGVLNGADFLISRYDNIVEKENQYRNIMIFMFYQSENKAMVNVLA